MLYRFFELVFSALQTAIFIEVILSWVYRGTNQFVEILHNITAPLLLPGRKIQERFFANTMVDFSPIIALFIIMIVKSIVLGLLG